MSLSGDRSEPHDNPLVPDLQPRPITMDEYYAYAPEKFELLEGYLFHGPTDPEGRHRLLQLLLVNVGLIEAIRLAPEDRWRAALAAACGPNRPSEP